MKHLNLQLERLEQRIAPGGCHASGGSHKSHSSKSHKSHSSKSGGSKSGGSKG